MAMMENDNGGHIYTTSNGIRVPSVTTIIGIMNKPGLAKWANMLGLNNVGYEQFLDERASIGTDFHKMVEDYMSGKQVGGTHFKESIDMFKRFMVWAENHHYKVFAHEQSLVGERFGGTIDAIGEVDGALTVIDYKTAKKVYADFFVQLAGYALLLQELMPETYERVQAFGVITMRKEEIYKFINKKDMEKHFIPVFQQAFELYMSWNKIANEVYW